MDGLPTVHRPLGALTVALTVALFGTSTALASPWTLAPGKTSVTIGAGFGQADQELRNEDGVEQAFPLRGALRTHDVFFAIRYGLREGTEVALATAVKSVVYQADTVLLRRIIPPDQVAATDPEALMDPSSRKQGLSDIYFTGRFRLVEGSMPMTTEVTLKLPTGYADPAPLDVALGDGQVDIKGSLLTGSYFSTTGSLVRLECGYNTRFNGPLDQAVYELKLGQFIGSKLLFYGGVRGALSVGEEVPTDEVAPTALDPSVPAAQFAFENIVYLPFSTSKSYHLAEAGVLLISRSTGLEYGLSMSRTVGGRNFPVISATNLSVTHAFD